MFSVALWLDSVKQKAGIDSDYRLSKLIKKNQSTLANYRSGRSMPDAAIIESLCRVSGDDPGLILAEIELLRAKDESARALWRDIAARLRLVPAAALVAATLAAGSAHAAVFALVPAAVSGYCLHTAGVAGSNPASPTRILFMFHVKRLIAFHVDLLLRVRRQILETAAAPIAGLRCA